MQAIIFSDVHLRDAESLKSKLLIRFLQEVASRFDRVYILGDLFDIWPGTSGFMVRTFRSVIQALRRLVDDGHQVHFVEGNHDFHLGEYFTETLGIKVYPNASTHVWEGKRIYMAHGDLGNPREIGYRLFRSVLRNQLTRLTLRALPQAFVFQVGLRGSEASRRYHTRNLREFQIRQIYRNTAERLFRQGYDVVLMGHTHLPDDVAAVVDGRPCRYINTGDWVRHFTYLEFDGTQFYTRVHPVTSL